MLPAIALYEQVRVSGRREMRALVFTTATSGEGRGDHVARQRAALAFGRRWMILAIETSCDDTCAAVVDRRWRDPLDVLLAGGARPLLGGVVPEIASLATTWSDETSLDFCRSVRHYEA